MSPHYIHKILLRCNRGLRILSVQNFHSEISLFTLTDNKSILRSKYVANEIPILQ